MTTWGVDCGLRLSYFSLDGVRESARPFCRSSVRRRVMGGSIEEREIEERDD
jgi:hypothetical protein